MRIRPGSPTRWPAKSSLRVILVLLFLVTVALIVGGITMAHQGAGVRKASRRGVGVRSSRADVAEDADDFRVRSLYERASERDDSVNKKSEKFSEWEAAAESKDARRESVLAAGATSLRRQFVVPSKRAKATLQNSSAAYRRDLGGVLADSLGPTIRERFLAEPIYGGGGDRFFEKVTQGRIPLSPTQGTSAIAWGDSAPNPHQRPSILRPFKTVSYTFTDEELLHMHHHIDVVVSWVNGSEINHRWRKFASNNLPKELQSRKNGGWFPTQTEQGKQYQLNTLTALERYLTGASRFTSTMDREHDELRYLIRSLHTNMKWHCGRIIVVSPGHVPRWLNRARNFFLSSVPKRRRVGSFNQCQNSVERRLIFVHQDSLLPSALRLTFNTNTIEAYIHRIRRLSNLYIHLNDDYMFRKPTSVTSFVNGKGGPVLLFESGRVRGWYQGQKWHAEQGWLGAVFHTNGFIEEVFSHGVFGDDDPFRPSSFRRLLGVEEDAVAVGGAMEGTSDTITPKAVGAFNPLSDWADDDMDIAFAISDLRNPPESLWPRPRYFLKHAPFVICRNMYKRQLLRYFKSRFSRAGKEHLRRNSLDYIPPQSHHAFVTDVPWAASSNFRPHHMSSSMRRAADDAVMRQWEVEMEQHADMNVAVPDEDTFYLDNNDGCAPALLKIGDPASAHVATFTDDMKRNRELLAHVDKTDPMFFTINDNGYSNGEVEEMLSNYSSSHFPFPCVAEHPDRMVYGVQRGRMSQNRDPRVPVIRNFTTAPPIPTNMTQPSLPPSIRVTGGRWRVGGLVAEGEAELVGHAEDLVASDRSFERGGGVPPQPQFLPSAERLYAPLPKEQLYHEERYQQFNHLPLVLSVHVSVQDLVVCAMLRSLKLALPDHEGRVFVHREGAGLTPEGMTPYDARPITLCGSFDQQRVEQLRGSSFGQLADKIAEAKRQQQRIKNVDPVLAATDAVFIRIGCTTAIGQTLALEDFTQRTIGELLDVLYLEAPCPKLRKHMLPTDLDPTAVNWVLAPTGQMLLQTFPLPYRRYEPNEKLVYGY